MINLKKQILQNKNNLIVNKFLQNGYVVIKALNKNDFCNFKKTVINRINKKLKKKLFTEKNINQYHNLIDGEEEHSKVILSERYVKLNSKIKNKISQNIQINQIIKNYWGHNRLVLKWIGSSLKRSQIKNNYCGYRISRPIKYKKFDTAGPHCDIHVGGRISSDKKIMITAWMPLEGFTKEYTLQLYKGLHHKLHSVSKIKKRKNTVSRIDQQNFVSVKKSYNNYL